jgi:hypothetical protein
MYVYILVYTLMYSIHAQDIIVIVPPYSYCIEEDRHEVALEDCWFARPQLFFKCCVRLKHGREQKNSNYKAGPGIYRYIHAYLSMYVFNHFIPDDLLHELVFSNTFEELHLPIQGPMEDSGVVKL